MFLICSDCGKMFWDGEVLCEPSCAESCEGLAGLIRSALCAECADSTVVRLSSSTKKNTSSKAIEIVSRETQ